MEHDDIATKEIRQLQAENKGLREACRRIEVITNMADNLDSAAELQSDLKIIKGIASKAFKGESDE